ncbi:MAG: 2-oxoglutarate dehydrogenase complex dihydrolipoyllysine-residue succinyltransferase [Candidatus Cloacimonetes bacterium]|nr:2-oxoglutarate dehydrogenase complex dihydrolipoyllysine-residue succinyltransferase [Candidatus Cloacimonadota bacterium]
MEMLIEMPSPGESVTEAQIAKWFKASGDFVKKNEVLMELETDKASLEIVAEADGVLEILVSEGEVVPVGTILGKIAASSAPAAKSVASAPSVVQAAEVVPDLKSFQSPAVKRISEEEKIDTSKISGSGKDGRVTKSDVLEAVAKPLATPEKSPVVSGNRVERPVALSMMRKRIAQRLKEVQNTAAILTTFNEVDLTEVMEIRQKYKDRFKEKHGANLGFMSFFTKAVIEGLKRFPGVNSEWRDSQIVYKDYYDIGVAVSTEKGLVVPVIRNAETLSLAGIEKEIVRLANRARDGKLSIEEMSGGTFTITNGGVFGSMLSTPILNSPQTAILGMHTIQKRPVALGDQVIIRPMMYLAVSYDHRVIDGREAVQFLVTVKECLEDPSRLLLEI